MRKKKRRSRIDRALDTLVDARGEVNLAIVRNAKLSGRYTAAMKRDFARGDEAGKRLAKKYFG